MLAFFKAPIQEFVWIGERLKMDGTEIFVKSFGSSLLGEVKVKKIHVTS
jgi:hypothetical protein